MNNPNQTGSGPIAAGSLFRPHPYPLPQERGCCARPMEATEADERDQAVDTGQSRFSDQIRSDPTKSNQIKPNQTKKSELRWNVQGQFRINAQAVRSKLRRTNLGFGQGRWMRGNAKRMNGQAKCLSDRNTSFICYSDERGLGLEENLRLCSPMFACVRLCSLMFASWEKNS